MRRSPPTASRTRITDHAPVWRVVRDVRAAAPCGCGPPHLPGPCFPAVTPMWSCLLDQVTPAEARSVLRGQQPPAAAVCVSFMGMTVPGLGCAPGSRTGAERVQSPGRQEACGTTTHCQSADAVSGRCVEPVADAAHRLQR